MIDFGHGIKLDTIDSIPLETLREWRNDPAIWRWTRQNDLIPIHDQIKWKDKLASDPTVRMYAIEQYGVCGLTSIDWQNRRAEFSLYIAPEFQRQGIAKKALCTLLDHGFINMGLNLIWGETFAGNVAAKFFEGLGFTHEGARRSFYWKGGKFVDAHLYSILSSEWNNRVPARAPVIEHTIGSTPDPEVTAILEDLETTKAQEH